MSQKIQFTSDKTGSEEQMKGSDGRANVSSRSDSRAYYNSRDESEEFSLSWDDASSEAGDFILYWKNADTTGRQLVISIIDFNSENAGSFKLHTVTGTAAAGATVVPFCSNRAAPKSAQAVAMEAAGTPISGLTSVGVHTHVGVGASCGREWDISDTVRIGQDGAIAIEYEQGTTGRTWGTILAYYE